MRISLRVNGVEAEADCWEGESLLYALREKLGYPGSKNACEQGECGSCSVLLDGTLVCACLVLAAQADGHEVTTVEGLADGEQLHPVQEAFVETGAVQCGFCTPGLVVAAADLLERTPDPSDDEIREALSGNLCRCTGYEKIFDAVRLAAQGRLADEPARKLGTKDTLRAGAAARAMNPGGWWVVLLPTQGGVCLVVGRVGLAPGGARCGEPEEAAAEARRRRLAPRKLERRADRRERSSRADATPKVKGEFAYSSDLNAPGMLWGHTLRSPHAHARIRAIDISEAVDDAGRPRRAHPRRRPGREALRARVPRPARARDRPRPLLRRAGRARRRRASRAGAARGREDPRRLRAARARRRHGAGDRAGPSSIPTGRPRATATATTRARTSSARS